MRSAVLLVVGAVMDAGAEPCGFVPWTQYRGVEMFAHRGTDSSHRPYFFITGHMAVDADGAPNAYHPFDVGHACTGAHPFKGIDCPANAGYPNATWWRSVLVEDPDDRSRAFVQPAGEFRGYFVSKTALVNNSAHEQDPRRYVDARRVPYLVFPGRYYRDMIGTGRLGDLGVAFNLVSGAQSAFVVADIGPADAPLGEISIALAEELGSISPNPRTGNGTLADDVLYLVFPMSSRTRSWPMAAGALRHVALELLDSVGGMATLAACDGVHSRLD